MTDSAIRTSEEREALAIGLDDVLASTLSLSILLDSAARGMAPDSVRLQPLSELGWHSLAIAEEHGGLGLDDRTLALIGWVGGRRLVPIPFRLEMSIVAPILGAAAFGGDGEAAALLDELAVGETAIAAMTPATPTTTRAAGPGWSRRDPEWVLAVDMERAFLFPTKHPTVSVQPSKGIDPGQGLVRIDVKEPGRELLLPPATIALVLYRALLVELGEVLGISDRVMEATVAFAGERTQFGKPLTAFQAVSHMLADMKAKTELIRSAVVDVIGGGKDGQVPGPLAASIPGLAREVVETAIQVHGGMGFTWEYGLHLYYRRVLQIEALRGSDIVPVDREGGF